MSGQDPVEAYRRFQEHRENFRRDMEMMVAHTREWALVNHTAAIDFAQSALKASTLINVGGFVAIQAAVPLFKLEGVSQWSLLITGIWFALGLVAAWLSYGVGFHALAFGSDSSTLSAKAENYRLLTQYHSTDPQAPAWDKERAKIAKQAARYNGAFQILRALGILLFWACVVCFFGGAREGVCLIVHALPPPAPWWLFRVIC